MDRLNRTIMGDPGYEWVGRLLTNNNVDAIASLPCYSEASVDEQRGKDAFEASIRALQSRNALAAPARSAVNGPTSRSLAVADHCYGCTVGAVRAAVAR
ncbi:MAG: hypothetical protein ABI365_06570 [Lysobacteraceae bacterium]